MEAPHALKTVFIVEDSVPVRARLVELIGDIDGVNVVGEAATPIAAVSGILRTHPQYVVLDFQLDGGTGMEVLRTIRPQLPETVFIVLTNYSQPQFRQTCMAAGATAFLDKSTEFAKVKEVIAGN
jgi:DNA-binding NarL/FixJ family response regulator